MKFVKLDPKNFRFLLALFFSVSTFTANTTVAKVQDLSISFDPLPEVCAELEQDCSGLVNYPFQLSTDCNQDGIDIQVFLDLNDMGVLSSVTDSLTGAYPDYAITGRYPIGAHRFEVVVVDACGDTITANLYFTVVDCTAPAPICLNGIAVALEPIDTGGDTLAYGDAEAIVFAADFLAWPVDDCSMPVKYSINKVGEPADPDQSELLLTCEDEGTLVIEVWAHDAAGHSDFCETYILIQDPDYLCTPGPSTYRGQITTEEGNPMAFNAIALGGANESMADANFMGAFDLQLFSEADTVVITPQSPVDYSNGVSPLDVIIVAGHIAGVAPLSSPYKRIAADVNNSGDLSIRDLIRMQKLFLGNIDTLEATDSWLYIPTEYAFPDPANPWLVPWPSSIRIASPAQPLFSGLDFIAIKMGDVNGDAETD